MISAKRIAISGLTFNDTLSETTTQYSIIDVLQASDLNITNNYFTGAKNAAIALNQVSRAVIANNSIDSSEIFGIWSGDSTELYIHSNTISNSWANGTLVSVSNSKIVENEYVNNHHKTVFGVSGGQIDIEHYSNQIYIGCNNIHDSTIVGSSFAYGLETAPVHVNNIEVVGNSIFNNDGYAVCINYGNSDMSNIVIHNNSFHNNLVSPVTHTQYDYNGYTPTLYSNCSNSSCLVSCDITIDSIFADGFD